MVCALVNYLGTGSSPKLHLELGDNGPKWGKFNIDYGAAGDVPWIANDPNREWVVWNVKDENGNFYGSISLKNSNGAHVEWDTYNAGKGYWLVDITLTPQGSTTYQLKCGAIHAPRERPPIISNLGWFNGMGNTNSQPSEGKSFWVQDYGIDLWSPNIGIDAILQSTAGVVRGGTHYYGSRAYPIRIVNGAPNWQVSGGVGVAFDGLWQIDVKIGSNGTGNFCETFYLAERSSFEWGPSHYGDGSNSASYASREIDIMETKWTSTGPQINLPQGGDTGWAPIPRDWGWKKAPDWADVGGAPTKNFITFGCLIRDGNLWLYAYNEDIQWYATKAIPKNNSYEQRHPFAPYIGTWAAPTPTPYPDSGFYTAYKNFTYLRQDDLKIKGKNPADNPEAFGKPLVN